MSFSAKNLFNRLYHDHLSLYRSYAPEPGIDVSLSIVVPFAW